MAAHRLRRALLAGCLAAVLVPAAASAAATWTLQVSVDPFSGFTDVAHVAPGVDWAVGTAEVDTDHGSVSEPVVEQNSGSGWSALPAPPVPADARFGLNLYRVAGTSTSNVWVIGDTEVGGVGRERSIVSHWDGAGWTNYEIDGGSFVAHLAVIADDDVWVLTASGRGTHGRYLHWTADGLTTGALPAVPTFESGSTVAPAWAPARSSDPHRGGLLHLVDGAWRVVAAPDVTLPAGAVSWSVNDVVDNGAGDVAVTIGYDADEGQFPQLTIYRLDGDQWRRVFGRHGAAPFGLAADGSGGLWVLNAGVRQQEQLWHIEGGALTGRVFAPVFGGHHMQIEAFVVDGPEPRFTAVGETIARGDASGVIASYG